MEKPTNIPLFFLLLLLLSGCFRDEPAIPGTSGIFSREWVPRATFPLGVTGAVAFSIGDRGYVGLGLADFQNSTEYLSQFWRYDAGANSWDTAAFFPGRNAAFAVAFTIEGKAYVGTGETGINEYSRDFWEFDPAGSQPWKRITSFPGPARSGAVAFSLNGKGYVGLGESSSGLFDDFYEYDPSSDTWTPISASFPGGPLKGATCFVVGGKAYVGLGEGPSGSYPNTFWVFNGQSWESNALVFPITGRAYATGFSIGDRGYIGFGINNSSVETFQDFYEWSANGFTRLTGFGGEPRAGAVSFVRGDKAYAGLGFPLTIALRSYKRDFYEFLPSN